MILAFKIFMKTLLLLLTSITFSVFLSGCVNKHGISAKYYSDCKEYYDLQGYYHKECGKDDIVTYQGIKQNTKETVDTTIDTIKQAFKEKKEPKQIKNVW